MNYFYKNKGLIVSTNVTKSKYYALNNKIKDHEISQSQPKKTDL